MILVKTLKGYGMGPGGEGRNITHQKKKMNESERQASAQRFGIPMSPEEIEVAALYHPGEDSPEVAYLQQCRKQLGGFQPVREAQCMSLPEPDESAFADALAGTERSISTTMSLVRMISKLMRDPDIGQFVVPIVPDEARTFGMDDLFRQVGIYSPHGQNYRPVDADSISPYRESASGQILEEGICEAGAMASFMAAGSAYSHFGVPTIPFYIFYSMFGFQRVGDLIWACGDSLCRGFLVGGTAGRTTLNGEGLQHEDGHSHVVANTVPNLMSYDPAFAFELAVIVREGIRRMYVAQDDVFYYLTVYNENHAQPSQPQNSGDGIIRGIYCYQASRIEGARRRVSLLGSGSIMQQVLGAAQRLEEQGIASDVYSVTSYSQLYRDAIECEDWNRLHPDEEQRAPYITQVLGNDDDVVIATSDYMKALPATVANWVPGRLICLGTDGYGLSESRPVLRQYFGIDSDAIVSAALGALQHTS